MKSILLALVFSFISVFYSNAQIAEQQFSIEISEAFELANILVALTKFGENDDNIVRKNTVYYDSVMSYFSVYKNHRAIRKLNDFFDKSKSQNYRNYNYFRTGSYFSSIQNQQLVRNKHSYSNETFTKFESDINDFIKETGFQKFFNNHRQTYDGYVSTYMSTVPLEDIISWLNQQFPARYGKFNIAMSPLIGGNHNTLRYKESNQNVTLMVVNVPSGIISNEKINSLTKGLIICNVFTEIDHHYINPITDSYGKALKKNIKNLLCWNDKTQGYNSAYLTFNEYMTWATYSLFLKDHFNKDSFEVINNSITSFMQDRRGFIKYDLFNNQLLKLYAADDASVDQLIPKMIEWMGEITCEANND